MVALSKTANAEITIKASRRLFSCQNRRNTKQIGSRYVCFVKNAANASKTIPAMRQKVILSSFLTVKARYSIVEAKAAAIKSERISAIHICIGNIANPARQVTKAASLLPVSFLVIFVAAHKQTANPKTDNILPHHI